MFSNIGGLEVLFVMLVALVVLGPTKLPEAARQVGKFVNEARRMSAGFQKEFREAVQDPIIEAEARARGSMEKAKSAVTEPFQALSEPVESAKPTPTPDPTTSPNEATSANEATPPDEGNGQ
ncbi:MAG: Sec-independent protein translocase protein TatB [Acidimicrobiales bacterium]